MPNRKRSREEEKTHESSPSSQLKASKREERETALKERKNQYRGYSPLSSSSVERVSIESLSPESFFYSYIAKRKPVVITGFIRDKAWKAGERWTNKYLEERAGREKVRVEFRREREENFGKGQCTTMTFSSFLQAIREGKEDFYLTTQYPLQEESRRKRKEEREREREKREKDMGESLIEEEIMGPPLRQLRGDFPLRPSLMGNLIPQNLNIWFGHTLSFSSTPLHHDYHDNLYILLRGEKEFSLLSPLFAEETETKGEIDRVLPNGLISYRNAPTTEDGVDLRDMKKFQLEKEKEAVERELAIAEKEARAGKKGAKKKVQAAEERLDEIMAELLDEGIGEEEDDDFDDEEEDEEGDTHIPDEGEEESEDDEEDNEEDVEKEEPDKQGKDEEREEDEEEVPNSFCSKSASSLSRSLPLLQCRLKQGDMLYLPASWFHEVKSLSCNGEGTEGEKEGEKGHLAFNYWFHPPHFSENPSFASPYPSKFWEEKWKKLNGDLSLGATG